MINSLKPYSPLTSLRLRWGITALCCGLVLLSGYRLLAAEWQPAFATRWLIQAAIAMVYLLSVLWGSLSQNLRAGETMLLADFGAGNTATLLRGVLIAALAGFLDLVESDDAEHDRYSRCDGAR